MAHRTRIRPNLAAWALNSAVQNTEFDGFDQGQFAAIDGDAGGVWAPASKIIIGGANGLDMFAPFRSVAASGFFVASMQAQNWPERSSCVAGGVLNSGLPLAYATGIVGGRYCVIAASDKRSYTSEDGSVWTQRGIVSANAVSDVAYGLVSGSPAFIAVDSGSSALTSSDGITWASTATLGGFTEAIAYAASLGLWVVVGNGTIRTSTTGVGWTSRTVPGGWTGKTTQRVVWNGSLFVAISSTSYSKLMTSPDGVTWTEAILPVTASWTGIAWGAYDSCWLLTSAAGDVVRSFDGITWSYASSIPVGANDIACNVSLWIIPTLNGSNGGVAWSVDFGTTWNKLPVGSHITTLQGYARVIFASNRFLMTRSSASALEFVMSVRSS